MLRVAFNTITIPLDPTEAKKMNTGRILTPIEIAVARRIGSDLQAVAQQKQHPINSKSLQISSPGLSPPRRIFH